MFQEDMPNSKVLFPFDVEEDHYVAHVVEAGDFPFNKGENDDGSGGDEGGESESESPESPSDSGDSEKSDSGDSDSGGEKKHKEKGGVEGKLDEVLGLLHQLLGDAGGAPPDLGPPGMDMPPSVDVGAPLPGDGPLPKPAVKHNMPGVPGGPTFAKRSGTVWREDEEGLTTKQVVMEARAMFPGYTVRQAVKKLGAYEVDGAEVKRPVWLIALQESE